MLSKAMSCPETGCLNLDRRFFIFLQYNKKTIRNVTRQITKQKRIFHIENDHHLIDLSSSIGGGVTGDVTVTVVVTGVVMEVVTEVVTGDVTVT